MQARLRVLDLLRLPRGLVERPRPRRAPAAARAAAAAASPCPVLFLSPVWPERSSSAAGVRTDDLISAFLERGHRVSYAASAAPNEHTALLAARGVATAQCLPNREADLLAVLAAAGLIDGSVGVAGRGEPRHGQQASSICVFDRFYAEEMFSFRVRGAAPACLRVLDMQDLHFLRAARAEAAAAGAAPAAALAARPGADSPAVLREVAAVLRSDLTLVCSPAELEILAAPPYSLPPSKLALAPFFAPPSPHAAAPRGWADRRHFAMLGTFRHPPNADSVEWALAEVWPRARALLAAAAGAAGADAPELHIYGADAPSAAAARLHRPREGVHFRGFAPTLDFLPEYRALLAPLRFGAGLKGKVVDAWWHGTPVVTTPVGAEGMLGVGGDAAGAWGGLGANATAEALAADASRLYADAELWGGCQRRGFALLAELYGREERLGAVLDAVAAAASGLAARREADVAGALLWREAARSTEFFSRWVELKERGAAAAAAAAAEAHEA
jgi:glycosyltransferase involved in cell wall biosynthesis